MLTSEIKACLSKCVLCWLATSSEENIPNVSPKETFAVYGSDRILIANIASPKSAANIKENENVCVSFIDIFVQKGFQLKGVARVLELSEPEYLVKSKLLKELAGEKFPIVNIIEIIVTSAKPILAPSYKLYPGTKETDQILAALNTYRVRELLRSSDL